MRGALDLWVDGAKAAINVDFAPDALPMPGETPPPGGWKGPAKLDALEQFGDE